LRAYLTQVLVPELETGDIVIMDNPPSRPPKMSTRDAMFRATFLAQLDLQARLLVRPVP
jgi:hypothetical protein